MAALCATSSASSRLTACLLGLASGFVVPHVVVFLCPLGADTTRGHSLQRALNGPRAEIDVSEYECQPDDGGYCVNYIRRLHRLARLPEQWEIEQDARYTHGAA